MLSSRSLSFISKLTKVANKSSISLQTFTKSRQCFLIFNSSFNCRLLSSDSVDARKYSSKHEWVTVDGSTATIGISQYAQENLGDIVYAQLPDPGAELSRDDDCGALESVKAASEIYSPLTGTVSEKNLKVEETPDLINKSCYDEGWLYKMSVTDSAELEDLMDESAYKSFLEGL